MTAQRIYLSTEPTDMRGGFDRLAGKVLAANLDLFAGHLFVFVSRRRKHLKVLSWDGTGTVPQDAIAVEEDCHAVWRGHHLRCDWPRVDGRPRVHRHNPQPCSVVMSNSSEIAHRP